MIRLRGAAAVDFAEHAALADLPGARWEVVLHPEPPEFAAPTSPMAIDPGREIRFSRPGAVVFRV